MKTIFGTCFSIALFLQLHVSAQSEDHQVFRGSSSNYQSELDIFIENPRTQLWDKSLIAFDTAATNHFDNQYDANKFMGASNRETLYTLNDGQKMSINVLKNIISNPFVDMALYPGSNDSFIISFVGDTTFDNTSYIVLEDLRTKVLHDVRKGSYEFWADSAENPSRFIVHFTPPAVISATDGTCQNMGSIKVTQAGPAYWNYVLKDSASNKIIETGILNTNSQLVAGVLPGHYILTLTDTNNYTATKHIIIGGYPAIVSGFTVSSSNVSVQTPVTFSSNSQDAEHISWNFGDGTSTSGVTNPSHSYTSAGVYSVILSVSNSEGCSSSQSQTVVVNTATGISDIYTGNINMWSYSGNVFIDFAHAENTNATIKIFDMLGRELINEKYSGSSLYQKNIKSIDEAYVIVNVTSEGQITNKKLFISNSK